MFVPSAGLERTGVIAVMGRFFSKIAGTSELRVMLVMMTMVAVLSAFVNNTPIVVVFLPIVLARPCDRVEGFQPLIPLSFASILGGTCTLTGTSTNLIIDDVSQDFGLEPFGMFELTKLELSTWWLASFTCSSSGASYCRSAARSRINRQRSDP